MEGNKIEELNKGLKAFREDAVKDELAQKRVEVAVVTFGERVETMDFTPIDKFESPALKASGQTPMGEGILKALEILEARKQLYKSQGVSYYRPWIFMITDGEPTDMNVGDGKFNTIVGKLREGSATKKFIFYTLGVDQANLSILNMLTPPEIPPSMLSGVDFKKFFTWLSGTMKSVAQSRPGKDVILPPRDFIQIQV